MHIEGGRVLIYNREHPSGVLLDESSYLESTVQTGGRDVDLSLGENDYFVMGDNRSDSSDSRFWGALPDNFLVGRVWFRAFPVDRFSFFSADRIGFLSL